MRYFGKRTWCGLSLFGAVIAGCISESPELLDGGAEAGQTIANAKPLSAVEAAGGGTRGGNTNDNGGTNGNDNGGGPCCPDFDADGGVDLSDLTLLLSSFGVQAGSPCMDADGDGLVGLQDLTVFLSQFGASCGGGNTNDNGGTNTNDNGGTNTNDNGGTNTNDNGGTNTNDNGGTNTNDNGGTNTNDNGGTNTNDNGGTNTNDNGGTNTNDNGGTNTNDNGGTNTNDNGGTNTNDNGGSNTNDNGGANTNDNGGNGNDNGTCPDGSTRVRAQLSGSDNNEAEYRDFNGACQRFRVRVRDLAAFTTYTVLVNGAAVGSLTTDDRGRGELEYTPLPAGFPVIQPGDVISVGPVSGTFQDDCSSNVNCNG